MWYVGLDVHSKVTMACILDEKGDKVKSLTIRGGISQIPGALKAAIPGRFAVAYEASCGYGWLHDQLVRLAEKVQVAHPGGLRLIFRSKRKNDRVDAEKLAKLLRLDMVPLVHVPSAAVRSWRRLVERRHYLVGCRTQAKNALRALLRTHAVVSPKSLWSKAGMAWLAELEFGTEDDRFQRDLLLEDVVYHTRHTKALEKRLDKIGGKEPGVELLRTIPGVGPRTAEAVVAYIDRADRFRRNKSVGTYFGLVPCEHTSVKQRLGHITREGPATVRRLVLEASWQVIRRDAGMRRFFQRLTRGKKDRKKIAIVAVAHKLIRSMQAMLLTGEVWRTVA